MLNKLQQASQCCRAQTRADARQHHCRPERGGIAAGEDGCDHDGEARDVARQPTTTRTRCQAVLR